MAERERVEIEDCDEAAAGGGGGGGGAAEEVEERRERLEERALEEEGAAEVASARLRLRVSIQKQNPPQIETDSLARLAR